MKSFIFSLLFLLSGFLSFGQGYNVTVCVNLTGQSAVNPTFLQLDYFNGVSTLSQQATIAPIPANPSVCFTPYLLIPDSTGNAYAFGNVLIPVCGVMVGFQNVITQDTVINLTINNCPSQACTSSIYSFGPSQNQLVATSTGVPPFSFLWNTGATDSLIAVNTPGLYCVSVTDALGCTDTVCYSYTGGSNCSVSIFSYTDSVSGLPALSVVPDTNNTLIGASILWNNGFSIPDIIINQPAQYCVTVTFSNGCSANTCYTVAPGSCQVSLAPVLGTNSLLATSFGTPPFLFSWDNGATYAQFPSINGSAPGTYCVQMMDGSGCVANDCYTVSPAASCTTTINIQGANPYFLSGSSTGTPPFSYLWSTGSNASNIQTSSPGVYCLVITDALGCSDTACFTIQSGQNCTASIVSSIDPILGFTLSAIPDTGAPVSGYQWSNGPTSSIIQPAVQGNYCVVITYTNGCSATACFNYVPTCQASVIMDTDLNGGVFLTALSDSSSQVSSYIWSNGGTTANIYPTGPGSYCVSIVYVSGCIANACYTFNPAGNNGCAVYASAIQDSINPALYYLFSYPSGQPPFSYQWLFSDGTTSTLADPVHQFSSFFSGEWAMVSVTDSAGCVSNYTFVLNPFPPVANCAASYQISANYQFGNPGELFFFDNSSSQGNGVAVSYNWNFGDGTSSTLANPVHTFAGGGVYYVCLTTTFSSGCSASVCHPVYIDLGWWNGTPPFQGNCSAFFSTISPPVGQGMLNLINLSQGNHLFYTWTLSNGFGSNVPNPIMILNNSGSYELCLQILDTLSGCSDTYCDSVFVDSLGNVYRSSLNGNVAIRVVIAPQPNSLLGVHDTQQKDAPVIYPNPGHGVLSFNQALESSALVEIFDITGKIILEELLSKGEQSLHVEGLQPGIYQIRLSSENEVFHYRQVINQ